MAVTTARDIEWLPPVPACLASFVNIRQAHLHEDDKTTFRVVEIKYLKIKPSKEQATAYENWLTALYKERAKRCKPMSLIVGRSFTEINKLIKLMKGGLTKSRLRDIETRVNTTCADAIRMAVAKMMIKLPPDGVSRSLLQSAIRKETPLVHTEVV